MFKKLIEFFSRKKNKKNKEFHVLKRLLESDVINPNGVDPNMTKRGFKAFVTRKFSIIEKNLQRTISLSDSNRDRMRNMETEQQTLKKEIEELKRKIETYMPVITTSTSCPVIITGTSGQAITTTKEEEA